jgi:hypothetical protein
MNERKKSGRSLPAMLFDLDGTLVDSVYQHVIAWSESFDHYGVHIPAWKIHRRIGMSEKLFAPMLLREIGHKADRTRIEELEKRELRNLERQLREVRILSGAVDLVRGLSRLGISWAIARSSKTFRPLSEPDISFSCSITAPNCSSTGLTKCSGRRKSSSLCVPPTFALFSPVRNMGIDQVR